MDNSVPTIFFYRTSHPFSNFHPSVFMADGLLFSRAEQYIMYRKALLFQDHRTAEQILRATSPRECKGLGRKVQPFDETVWAAAHEQIALETCLHKFEHNEKLRIILLDTGDALLVEAAPTDRIWGIGFGEDDALAYRHQWGMNLLGQALMRTRSVLQASGKP